MHGRGWPGSGPQHGFDHVPPAKFQKPALNAPSTPQITLYTSAVCGYCVAAKNFLPSRGLAWNEVRLDTDTAERERMVSLARRTRVPPISVREPHVGAAAALMALPPAARFLPLLSREPRY